MLTLNRAAGERAMIIKTADGDRAVIFSHWANMRKGRAGMAMYSSLMLRSH